MKHIHTFESFLNEGLGVGTIMTEIKNGAGWASVDYIHNLPINRAGKMALAQMLAAEGMLFADEDLTDKHHEGNADPIEDGVAPMSINDAKNLF
jgi:hypothetical protein